MMEPQDHSNIDPTQIMIKGKRTKRPRPLSPLRLAVSCSSGSGGDELYHGRLSSPCSSIEFAGSAVGGEEEDMANCLILLAQGSQDHAPKREAVASTATTNKGIDSGAAAAYVYQCKTCNRCFPSFQALGGHRASHKKPNNKSGTNEEKNKRVNEEDEDHRRVPNNLEAYMNTTLSLQLANRAGSYGSNCSSTNMIKPNKVHECSVCGAEFSSGQALGGHMRRHRAAFATTTTTPAAAAASPITTTTTVSLVTSRSSTPEFQETKKPRRNSLQLDLNLPAPEDDHKESKLRLASKDQVLVFSASPLVDCHY